ncbi:hypothetical protein C4D60_Mb02t23550 [Musa balbisiana]|uniref:Protein kinase domain-containing protein n=1 Tax=Musa balbisiana TaxID=52838 RepID=A0A4S8ICW0_MUSBA|nr:hypothetical protein C4D60_Mb02t23550 [Musa balbisiana]
MKVLNCFKDEKSIRNARTQRRLSLGEYRRAVSWSKYLVSYGGEIKGGREEQWSADMSKLLIGNKFATGRHSRIYHGKYKERDVAIKLMSQPEEDAALAAALEQQFTSEAALLFHLRHPNIITNARPTLPASCPVAFSSLIHKCWATNPDKRLQFDEIIAILESYEESLRLDPTFFLSYKPVQQQTLLKCFPRRTAVRKSNPLEA